jgi:hypothetical protein
VTVDIQVSVASKTGTLCASASFSGAIPGTGEVDAMNDTAIISAVIIFLIVLGFCIWFSFSSRVIGTEELLLRAGTAAAIVVAALVTAGAHRHRNVH